MAAVKRDAAGSDKPKAEVQQLEQLEAIAKEFTALEIDLDRKAHIASQSLYEKRRAVLKAIPNFWLQAYGASSDLAAFLQLPEDQEALSFLEDVWLVRDDAEPRVFTIELYFKENPFFSETVLKKVFKYTPDAEKTSNQKTYPSGITHAAVEFDWDEDVTPEVTTISWKDDEHNLCKKYPLNIDKDEDGDEIPIEAGSFFNFFLATKDHFELGPTLSSVFQEAVELFLNPEDEDITDDEEENASDEEEIDLEQPKRKKVKA